MDKSIEVSPQSWVSMDDEGVHVAWPLVKSRKKLLEMIQNQVPPEAHWKVYSVTILRKCGMCFHVFTVNIYLIQYIGLLLYKLTMLSCTCVTLTLINVMSILIGRVTGLARPSACPSVRPFFVRLNIKLFIHSYSFINSCQTATKHVYGDAINSTLFNNSTILE